MDYVAISFVVCVGGWRELYDLFPVEKNGFISWKSGAEVGTRVVNEE